MGQVVTSHQEIAVIDGDCLGMGGDTGCGEQHPHAAPGEQSRSGSVLGSHRISSFQDDRYLDPAPLGRDQLACLRARSVAG